MRIIYGYSVNLLLTLTTNHLHYDCLFAEQSIDSLLKSNPALWGKFNGTTTAFTLCPPAPNSSTKPRRLSLDD